MVTNARKVLDTAAADQNDGVLLQVVTDTGNVSGDLVTVRQTLTGNLTQGVQGRMQARSKYGAKRPKAGKKK